MPTLVDMVFPVSHHCSQLSGSGTRGASSVPDHQCRTSRPSSGPVQFASVPVVPLKPSTVPLHPSAYQVAPPDPPPWVFWNPGSTNGFSNVVLKLRSTPMPLLPEPFRVVIRITPLAAREPYSAPAFAPLSTLMLAILLGSISEMPPPYCWFCLRLKLLLARVPSELLPKFAPLVVCAIGTPSITMSG